MTRDIGPGAIHDVGQVKARQDILNQLGAEFSLHKAVRDDQADETPRLLGGACDGEIEETLDEGERLAHTSCGN